MIHFEEIHFYLAGPRGVLDSKKLDPAHIHSYKINHQEGRNPSVTLMFKNKVLKHGPVTISYEEFQKRVLPTLKEVELADMAI